MHDERAVGAELNRFNMIEQHNFSIIIPTRDRPNLLPRSVASALAATGEGDEIIVVDDGSRFSPAESLSNFDYPRLRIVKGEGKGAAHARNVGIKESHGAILMFLDDDDEMLPGDRKHVLGRVNNVVPSPHFGYSSVYRVGCADRASGQLPEGYFHTRYPFTSLLNGFGMGFWAHKAVFENLGLIDETLVTNEDTEFLLRLLASEHIGWYSNFPGVRLGRADNIGHDLGSLTHRTPATVRADAFSSILARHFKLIDTLDGARGYFRKRIVKYLARAGRLRDALIVADRRPGEVTLAIGEYVSGRMRSK